MEVLTTSAEPPPIQDRLPFNEASQLYVQHFFAARLRILNPGLISDEESLTAADTAVRKMHPSQMGAKLLELCQLPQNNVDLLVDDSEDPALIAISL